MNLAHSVYECLTESGEHVRNQRSKDSKNKLPGFPFVIHTLRTVIAREITDPFFPGG